MKNLEMFEKFKIFKKSKLDDNLSAEYHLNKQKGKKPYIKKGGFFIEVPARKTIPADVTFLTDNQVIKYNKVSKEIKRLQDLQENILKNN